MLLIPGNLHGSTPHSISPASFLGNRTLPKLTSTLAVTSNWLDFDYLGNYFNATISFDYLFLANHTKAQPPLNLLIICILTFLVNLTSHTL